MRAFTMSSGKNRIPRGIGNFSSYLFSFSSPEAGRVFGSGESDRAAAAITGRAVSRSALCREVYSTRGVESLAYPSGFCLVRADATRCGPTQGTWVTSESVKMQDDYKVNQYELGRGIGS